MKLSLSPNPVLIKELRGRMRGARAYLFLTATLALFGVTGYGMYRITQLASQSMGMGGQQSAVIGQSVFTGLVFLALGVICFITPALTAGAVSGEHERQTFDLLMATPLHPASVLFGKLVASLGYVVLLILAAVPLVSLSFVFGGVATIDMIQSLLLLVGFTLTFGVIGLFFSTLLRRTALATVLSYIVLAIFVAGTLFVYIVVGAIRQQQPPAWILALNPFSALASALVGPGGSPNVFSSMSGIVMPVLWLLGGGRFDTAVVASVPLWRYTVGIYAWLTVVLYAASTQLIKPVHRFRWGWRGWAGVASFGLVSIVAALAVYGPLTPGNVAAWLRWQSSSRRELVVNGSFRDPLDPAWTISAWADEPNEAPGQAMLVDDGDRPAVTFSRSGLKSASTEIVQALDQAVDGSTWLRVRAVLRVRSHDVQMCGVDGLWCPLAIKLVYRDAGGGQHEWRQGFFAAGNMALSSTAPFCATCEINQTHVQVPQDEWYTYESPNLIKDLVDRGYATPEYLESIALVAAGHSYEVQVAELALTLSETAPPDWGGHPWATPTPAPMMLEMSKRAMAVRVEPPLPEATAPPTPPVLVWDEERARNLVANGAFAEPLEPAWTTGTEVEVAEEAHGEVNLADSGGKVVANFRRAGLKSSATWITQQIDQDVSEQKWLQVRAVLHVEWHDLNLCGVKGSECPLLIKLVYEDENGARHEWIQGFFALEARDGDAPSFCTTCEINEAHIQVKPYEWFMYDSPNLMEYLPSRGAGSVYLIRSITLVAAGHSYETQVAGLALIASVSTSPLGGTLTATPLPPPTPPPTPPPVSPVEPTPTPVLLPLLPPLPQPT
ncbi:MAG: ABC transporter permease subunit [Thermoflexales bacterium]|nr:ABC transporter permease subunit [Thermoflexales bacterium]